MMVAIMELLRSSACLSWWSSPRQPEFGVFGCCVQIQHAEISIMRASFILTHRPGKKFQFMDYILASMDDDCAKVPHQHHRNSPQCTALHQAELLTSVLLVHMLHLLLVILHDAAQCASNLPLLLLMLMLSLSSSFLVVKKLACAPPCYSLSFFFGHVFLV